MSQFGKFANRKAKLECKILLLV